MNDGLEARSNAGLMTFFGAAILVALLGCSTSAATVKNQDGTAAATTGGGSASATEPECKMQSDGKNVCGYNCEMGSNGDVYCADTPDGICEFNSDGTYTCTQLAQSRTAAAPAGPPPECKMQSDGRKVCGYNCRMGSSGDVYCSSVPNGNCKMNSDGSFSCP